MAGGDKDRKAGLRVFISYRRDDVPGYSGRLHDHLARRFGEDHVFMDVDAIRPGTDFTEEIEEALEKCDVLLAVIGDGWLTSEDDGGRRRLDGPGDFVRLEIEAALRRNIPIIPLLFESATMPSMTELPASLAPLARRQALEMSDTRWRADVDQLITDLERLVRTETSDPPAVVGGERRRARSLVRSRRSLPMRGRLALIAGATVLVLLGMAVVLSWDNDYLHEPKGVAVSSAGVVYVSDKDRIFRVSGSGAIEPFAGGKRGADGYGDGGPASAAEFAGPRGLAVANGSLFVADYYHSTIRRIAADGTITTVAGNGEFGFDGDGGPATKAKLASPGGVAVANDGTIYIADTRNNRIRKVSNGIISTVAGNGAVGFGGDGGPATDAMLFEPEAVAVTATGVVYIADTNNHRIRSVDTSNTITTLAGNGDGSFSGEGEPAKDAGLRAPAGLAASADGALYLADSGNNRIRKIAGGLITTVAGSGASGYSGDGDQGRSAALNSPYGVGVAPDGTVVFTDMGNNQVRSIAPNGVISSVG